MIQALTRWQATLLGLTTTLAIGLAAAALFALGGRQRLWSETFEVRAGFPQIRGVESGTRVRVQGIDAGHVTAVIPPAAPRADVTLRLRLDGRFRSLLRADAVARILNEGMIGGKVVEIDPGSPTMDAIAPNALIATRATRELTDAAEQLSLEAGQTLKEVQAGVQQVSQTLQQVRQGEGAVGKELLQSLQQLRGTLTSIQRDADALQSLPLVGRYVKDPNQKLLRPECDRQSKCFREDEIFEPGQAILTGDGRNRLDEVGPWLKEHQGKGSEVVVAAFADSHASPEWAKVVTQKQSDVVCAYLKQQHGIHKTGWFSRREVTPVGFGVEPSPVTESGGLPSPRLEVVVFVPRSALN